MIKPFMFKVRLQIYISAIFFIASGQSGAVSGQETAISPDRFSPSDQMMETASNEEVVSFSSDFFARYQPSTALDMVRQVPGFQIDDGSGNRGFGGATGNILINNRRPSAKQDLPSAILARIPAASVERVDLIRGQLEGIDLQGRTVVANVVLRTDIPASIRWQAFLRENLDHGLAPGINVSFSDRWGNIEYNTGLDFRYTNFGDAGTENLFDANGVLLEERIEDDGAAGFDGFDLFAYLNASTWLGNNFIQINNKLGTISRDELLVNTRLPVAPGSVPTVTNIETEQRGLQYEFGLDVERLLHEDLLGKAIFLLFLKDQYPSNARRTFDTNGDLTVLRVADIDRFTMESIARLELTWAGLENHSIQLNLEGTYNVLDNRFVQTEYSGNGVSIIDVPGSNSRVEENRGDFSLRDTWTLGILNLEYGLGAEVSTISQTGDAEQKRNFFFLKPYASLIYAPAQASQTRIRLAREVSQLDFNDFVSATLFRDDNLALGNPNLKPESTWVSELSHERRFGDLGVVIVTLFHHWITDVEDLLPLTPLYEAPGNIGDGRRWGIELENTIPLDWLGLRSSRLDLKVRWQDSVVTDPVTGSRRVLSAVGGIDPGVSFRNENRYALLLGYRQDFQSARVSWGWDVAYQARRALYKVNEFEINQEQPAFNLFAETSRWFGIKLRIDALNLLNYDSTRERTRFTGQRDLSAVDYREMRRLNNGTRFTLTASGTF
jgi:hypothetical protein